MTEQRTAYRHSPAVGNSQAYMGLILTISVRGEDTGGRLAVVEAKTRPGNEPPPHINEWEDEVIYVLEGSAEFYCGTERFVVGAGDYLFIPQGVPHAMRFLAPSVRLIGALSAAGEHSVASDRYFLAISEPATSLDLPAAGAAETYATMADPAHAVRLAAEHGVRFLSPEEARELLPDYPGFGAHKRR
ncbi:MAG: cupin domain-containing protein [Acetobacteraceae bacterium]|nr:cupin domain-containing protein [Acetobacteraceae bacterium]